ncbi:MAG: cobalamin-dependent protein, partial [Dehalococcoidales bacterium]|nr:cobalamin-dependent protein [Dehalococcoidales bacterium]
MRVLLIPPKNNYPDPMPRVDIFGQGFPYIAGALKKAGHEVFGINLSDQWCGLSAPNKLAASIEKAVKEYQPDFVGVGGLSGDYAFVRDAIRFTRKAAPHTPVVCGGGIVTYDREYIFANLHPDFAVSGEAEDTIAPLADCLAGKGDIKTLPNIARWENSQPVYNPCEYSSTRLEDLPLPDYRPFDYGRFLESFNQTDVFYAHMRRHPRIMPISIGRSCPFHCTFCVHSHTAGPRYRQRSIDSAMAEIAHFYDKYHFNILFVYDELFSVKKERVIEFCAKIKKLKADLG